jgi:heptosyltransferase-3
VTGLVYHAGALGDFVAALPAIAAWRRRRTAGERLVLLGRPAHAVLAAGVVDDVWDAGGARLASLFAGRSSPEMQALLAYVASALVFASEGAGIVRGLESSGVRDIVRGDPFPRGRVHVVDHHLSMFPDLVLAPEDRLPRVEVAPAAGETMADVGRPIVLHPGSGSASKNWPLDRFIEVARQLSGSGPIAWALGPAEEESGLAAALAGAMRRALPRAQVWRSPPLADLARRLAGARLFVGNDSGVAHLAAAVGCPVVVLFGASDPAVWAPRGRAGVTVVGDGACGMEAIGGDAVVHAAIAAIRSNEPNAR